MVSNNGGARRNLTPCLEKLQTKVIHLCIKNYCSNTIYNTYIYNTLIMPLSLCKLMCSFFDKLSYCISDFEAGCCPQAVIYSWKRCCFGQLNDRGLGISRQSPFSPPIGSRQPTLFLALRTDCFFYTRGAWLLKRRKVKLECKSKATRRPIREKNSFDV